MKGIHTCLLLCISIGLVLAQNNNTFCIPESFTCSLFSTTNSVSNDGHSYITEYSAFLYFDVTQEAIRVDLTDTHTGIQVTILERFDQGLQYVYTNSSCSQNKLRETAFSNCNSYESKTGPFLVANELSALLVTSVSLSTNSSTEAIVSADTYFPISARSAGSWNNGASGGTFVEILVLYDTNSSSIPSSVFTPPSDCSTTPNSYFKMFKPVLLSPLYKK